MKFSERRRQARTPPEGLLYIDLKPDNGGIVLNVSRQGLCFQSVAPVKPHQVLAFTFSEHDVQTDAVGEVVWTDKTRKLGGLRFTALGADARTALQEDRAAAPPAENHRQLTTALQPLQIDKTSPLHAALLHEAGYVPAKPPRRAWVTRVAMVALAIYAFCASVALYRYSRRPAAATQLATTPPRPVTSTLPSHLEGPAPAHSSAVMPKPVARAAKRAAPSPEPDRPVIQAAPIKFGYPVMAAGARSGRVALKLLIDTAGTVESVTVLDGDRNLAAAATRAVRDWRYRPLLQNGRPVLAEAHVSMRFAGEDAVSISFRD
jgi:TonB family protein